MLVCHSLVKMAAFKEPDKCTERILQDESSQTCIPISEYAKKLTGNVKQRYLDKIQTLGFIQYLFPRRNTTQNVYHQLRLLTCCHISFLTQVFTQTNNLKQLEACKHITKWFQGYNKCARTYNS